MKALRHPVTALALLAVGMAAQYAWKHAPVPAQADVWNASLGLLLLALLALVAAVHGSSEVVAVCALLGAFAALQAGCSIAYLIRPWHVPEGGETCSAALNVPLGLVGLVLGGALAGYLYGRSRDG